MQKTLFMYCFGLPRFSGVKEDQMETSVVFVKFRRTWHIIVYKNASKAEIVRQTAHSSIVTTSVVLTTILASRTDKGWLSVFELFIKAKQNSIRLCGLVLPVKSFSTPRELLVLLPCYEMPCKLALIGKLRAIIYPGITEGTLQRVSGLWKRCLLIFLAG